MLESELYPPVKHFLTNLGFTVRSEVRGCDVVACRDDDVIVVELKKSVTMTLLLQGIDRQKITDAVYLAVETPRNTGRRRWQETVRLCRLLGLGLLTVTLRRHDAYVQVVCEPEPYRPRKSASRRRHILREFQKRTGDYNTGGSTRLPIVTAYREEALRIAQFLRNEGPSRLKDIREAVGSQKTDSILQRNVYGWFSRLSRGIYELTPEGEKALQMYANVLVPLNRDA